MASPLLHTTMKGVIKVKISIFEYGGYHFIPERKLSASEGSFRAISKRLRIDRDMGLCQRNYAYESKFSYSHKSFYAAAPDKECDLFRCIENGKMYIPCQNDLQEYLERPPKRRDSHER